jgi:hypothetical protein
MCHCEVQEPCEDAISREAMLEYQQYLHGKMSNEENHKLWEFIKELPSVTPKQKTGKWIPVSEKLPEEHEWIGTKRFGTTMSNEVYVTFETPKGDRFTKHLSFQNGKLSLADQQRINTLYKGSVPVAWMPLPEPYKAESEGEA